MRNAAFINPKPQTRNPKPETRNPKPQPLSLRIFFFKIRHRFINHVIKVDIYLKEDLNDRKYENKCFSPSQLEKHAAEYHGELLDEDPAIGLKHHPHHRNSLVFAAGDKRKKTSDQVADNKTAQHDRDIPVDIRIPVKKEMKQAGARGNDIG